ncbi:SRPBCC domain-containing protein [Nocardiopsis sp. NPDC058789]|uniref:SRPBCC domain-containing protein n=1 Tax=Nocardiopsis eucommiae TaxID=2831970 RepID=A0A975L9S4_9ACTN|nr:SRPBCC domain-containing protein [Nocardiopsis eucommiae]
MAVTSVDKDFENLTLAVTCDLTTSVDRAWELWSDPRQLERWWGPPTYPATVDRHDLTPGGVVTYHMTGPEGDEHHGWWQVKTVGAPRSLEITDGFGETPGDPGDLPVATMRLDISERGDGVRMVVRTTFASTEAMERMLDMGMAEGMQEAMGQIEDVLAS